MHPYCTLRNLTASTPLPESSLRSAASCISAFKTAAQHSIKTGSLKTPFTFSLFIMSFACSDDYIVSGLLVYYSILFVDPSAPPTIQSALQWFRFSYAGKWVPLCVANQLIDPPQSLFVFSLPTDIIIPCSVIPQNSHRLFFQEFVFFEHGTAGLDVSHDFTQVFHVRGGVERIN